MATGLDHDRYRRLYAKLTRGDLSLSAHSDRTKGYPTVALGTDFNVADAKTTDQQTALNLQYGMQLSATTDLSARLFYGLYR